MSVKGSKASVRAPSPVTAGSVHLPAKKVGLWGLTSISWNILNVFGGLSYMVIIGFSAGGIPTIFYGYIGTCIGVTAIMATFAECAAIFPTAGGAYHYALFLLPENHRRKAGYPLGWLNFFGWVLTIAACASIAAGLTMSLINMCNPDFDTSRRWQLFLFYILWSVVAWAINCFMLSAVAWIENVIVIMNIASFVAFSIALLAISDKASPSFVFRDVIDATGYNSASMAVALGLVNCMGGFAALDAACHLSEEIERPERNVPITLYFLIGSQFFVGVIYILVLGFSITDMETIQNSATGVPVIELVRLGLKSDSAAIVFNLVLLIGFVGSTLGSMTAASRQGYALARDGGLFTRKLTQVSGRNSLPLYSLHLCLLLCIVFGLVYLFSTEGFNAILGAEVSFMFLSFGSPSAVLLIFGRDKLPKTRFSLGKWGYGINAFVIFFVGIALVLFAIPQKHPVNAENMNYTVLLWGAVVILCILGWFIDARKSYEPTSFHELAEASSFLQTRTE